MSARASAAASRVAPTPRNEDYAGHLPALKYLPVGDLVVNHSYQRQVRDEGALNIGRIVERFDWRLVGALTVTPIEPESTTGGLKYAILDGQHRWVAALKRGDIPNLPCLIVKTIGVAEQAALFLALNRDRVAVQPIQQFWSSLVAGDRQAQAVKAACDGAGVAIARVQSGLHKPLETSSIATIRRALGELGPARTTDALRCLAEAHPRTPSAFGGPIMQAVFGLASRGMARADLVTALRGLDLKAVLVTARVERQDQGGTGSLADQLQQILLRRVEAGPARAARDVPVGESWAVRNRQPAAETPAPARAAPRPVFNGPIESTDPTRRSDFRRAPGPQVTEKLDAVSRDGGGPTSTVTMVKFLKSRDVDIRPHGATMWMVNGRQVIDSDGLLIMANNHRKTMKKPLYELEGW